MFGRPTGFDRRSVTAIAGSLVALAVVCAALGAGAGVAGASVGAGTGATLAVEGTVADTSGGVGVPGAAAGEPVDADDVVMEVMVDADGDATWAIEYRVTLQDEDDEAAFEDVQEEIEADPDGFVAPFADDMAGTVQRASEATERSMALEDVAVDSDVESLATTTGIVTYTFTWRGFAAVEEERVIAGDALDGLFLEENQQLLVGWPEGHELASTDPDPHEQRDRVVVWHGETNFVDGEPRVETASAGAADGTTTEDGLLPWSLATPAALLLVVALLAVVLVGGMGYVTRGESTGTETVGPADGAGGTTEPTTGSEDARTQPGDATIPDPPPELLSNEERVLRTVREHGGRMKQQDLVDALGWSDSKTSKVVNGLREAGDLEGFRLGRENVIGLPGQHDPLEDGDSEGGNPNGDGGIHDE